MSTTLFDGDTFEHKGYTFRVLIERDDDMGPPWKEHDGHGIVSEWTTRDKRPGERLLVEDRGSYRYYDQQATIRLARKDQWGCPHGRQIGADWDKGALVYWHGHTTQGRATACAVEADYRHLRGWCLDEWEWKYVRVVLQDDGVKQAEALGGIDGGDEYCTQVAYELADEIISRIEVETPDVQLSEN